VLPERRGEDEGRRERERERNIAVLHIDCRVASVVQSPLSAGSISQMREGRMNRPKYYTFEKLQTISRSSRLFLCFQDTTTRIVRV
jgi:hypothetical protein